MTSICPSVHYLFIGCLYDFWIGDGYCDDDNNFFDCNYDGGDCCGPDVNTQYCYECICMEDGNNHSNGTTPEGTIV